MHTQRKQISNVLLIISLILLKCSLAQDLIAEPELKSISFLQKTNSELETELETESELKETFDKDWMKGFWIGKGYGCGGRSNIPEDIHVEFVGDEFVATKENGDNCVPSGKVTFRGKIPETWEIKKQYPGRITLGSPARPASSQGNCNIIPIEKDKFRVGGWNLEFVRGRLYPPKEEPKVEEPKKEEPKKEEPEKEEPKKEEPKIEEPKVEEPKVEEPKVEEPIVVEKPKPKKEKKLQKQKPAACKEKNFDDHLPRGVDDEDVYTKHIDIVEKFRKAKNPYKKFKNEFEDEEEDLVLVPRKWLKVPHGWKRNGSPIRREHNHHNDSENDEEDTDEEDTDEEDTEEEKPRRKKNRGCACYARKQKKHDRLEN